MFVFMEDLPDDVLGFEVAGRITREDYRDVLIPAAEEKLKFHDKLKCLCVVGDRFEGYDLAAMWDDAAFGLKHWFDFSRMAVVTDKDWLRNMTAVFAPLIPGEVRVFDEDKLDQARDWITESGASEAA